MSEVLPFSLIFFSRHPQKAAKVLERMPVEDSVAFLLEIPLTQAARILETLAPQYAVQCFLIISPETCSELMQEMKATSGISLLRFMPNSMTQTILKQLLPDKKALLKKRLVYPHDLIGAWMDSEIPAVSETTLVGEIRKSLRRSKKVIEHAPCVVNPDGTLIGLLRIARLITAKDSIPVSKILERDFKSISDRATVQSVSSWPQWDHFEALPVVNQKNKFIGMLTHNSLKKALAMIKGDFSSDQIDSVLMDGVDSYISALAWLVKSMIAFPVDSFTNSTESKNGR